ncbi:hypothetical protein OAU50_05480 [Planctomycetota bacterium]|nr:hypothetical protein [Planctomycetota bacterium]
MKKLLSILMLAVLPMLAAQDFQSYTADVSGDSVRIRTGAGLAHPPIHVLAKGDKLVVTNIKEDWAIVQLPVNAPCWISAKFVVMSDDGKTYTVTGDRVNMRAAANTNYFPIGQAEKDQVLKACVDGRTGQGIKEEGFLRVIPPSNASGAVAKKFLTKVKDVDVAKIEKATPAKTVAEDTAEATETTTDEAKPVDESPVVKAETPDKPKRTPTPAELDDERKTFEELESLLRDELKKEAADVRLSAIRRMFEQFTEFALSDEVQKSAKGYIAKIDATEKLIEAEKKRLAEAEEARQKRLAELAKEAEDAGNEDAQPKGPVDYLVEGKLGSTGKLTKTPASHRLFDDEGEVLYDLRWDKGDLSKLVGARVGIVGTIKSYKGWPYKVVIVTRVDVLSDEEEK